MPAPIILQDLSGIGQGITTAGNAFNQALTQAGQNRQQQQLQGQRFAQERSMQEQRSQDSKDQLSLKQVINQQSEQAIRDQKSSALKTAMEEADKYGGIRTPEGQSAFIKGYGEYVNNPLDLFKNFNTQNNKVNDFTPKDKYQYKKNTDFLSESNSLARISQSLLKEADSVEAAINSGQLPGPGVVGKTGASIKGFFGMTPKEIQTVKTMQKRTLLELKQAKGMRLTDQKLIFLQDGMFDANKSQEQNVEGFRIWKDTLEEVVRASEIANQMIEDDENLLISPKFQGQINQILSGESEEDATNSEKQSEQQAPQSASEGNTVSKLPAKAKTGATATDTETGQVYRFNGKRWVKE